METPPRILVDKPSHCRNARLPTVVKDMPAEGHKVQNAKGTLQFAFVEKNFGVSSDFIHEIWGS